MSWLNHAGGNGSTHIAVDGGCHTTGTRVSDKTAGVIVRDLSARETRREYHMFRESGGEMSGYMVWRCATDTPPTNAHDYEERVYARYQTKRCVLPAYSRFIRIQKLARTEDSPATLRCRRDGCSRGEGMICTAISVDEHIPTIGSDNAQSVTAPARVVMPGRQMGSMRLFTIE